MVGRDDTEVDVRRTTLVTDGTRPFEAEAAGTVGDDGRAAGADVLPEPIRLPEMNSRPRQWSAVDGREDDAREDVASPDLRSQRRRAAPERAGPVVQRRCAAGCGGRGHTGAGGDKPDRYETRGVREQPHATWSTRSG